MPELTLDDFSKNLESTPSREIETEAPVSYYVEKAQQIASPVLGAMQWFSAPQEGAQRAAQAAWEGRFSDIPSDAWAGLRLEGGDTATWGDSILSPEAQAYNPIYRGMQALGETEIGGVPVDPAEMYRSVMVGGGELFIDPFVGVGMLGDVPQIVNRGASAADWAASTKLGRVLGLNPSEMNYGSLNRAASRVQPESQFVRRKIDEAIGGRRSAAVNRHGEDVITSDDFYTGLERPKSQQRKRFQADVEDLEKIRHYSRRYAEKNDRLRSELGLPLRGQIKDTDIYQWHPRNTDLPETVRRGGDLSKGAKEAGEFRGRTLFRWVDDDGAEVSMGKVSSNLVPVRGRKTPIKIKDVSHARKLLDENRLTQGAKRRVVRLPDEDGKSTFIHLGTGKRVTREQLSKPEAQALVGDKRTFKTDPYAAHAADLSAKASEHTFLTFAKRGLDDGWLKPVDEDVPKGWTKLDIPGMRHYMAPSPAVGRIERIAKAMFDPESFTNALEEGTRAVGRSKLGQAAKAFRHKWASWQLGAFPRFHLGNELSNNFLLYTAGIPAIEIPKYKAMAAALQAHERLPKHASRIAGKFTPQGAKTTWGPQKFNDFLERSGALTTWSRSEQLSKILGHRQSPGLMDMADEQISKLDETRLNRAAQGARGITAGIRKAGEIGDAITEAGFRHVGEPIENNARLAAALWYLDKATPSGKQPSIDTLQEAAYFAQQALFDYSDLSSFEQAIKTISPYWAFHRNMIRRLAKDAVRKPHILGRMERAGEAIFTTPTEGELYDAPPYLSENAAVTGIKGFGTLGRGTEGPRTALLGRFNPYTIADQLVSGPGGYGFNLLIPAAKAGIEMAYNQQMHSGWPIDRVVKDTPDTVTGLSDAAQGLIGPLVGLPTEKREEIFGLDIPNYWRYASDVLPTASFVREADKVVEAVGDLTGNEFLRDQSRPPYPWWQHSLRGLGINLYEPKYKDYEYYGERDESDFVRQLERQADRAYDDGRKNLAQQYQEQADYYRQKLAEKRAKAKRQSTSNSTAP